MSKDIKIVWKKCFPNISKMLCRRNFTFQEKLNEFTFLFYSHEKNKHLILICFFSDKVGVDCLKKHLKQSCNDKVKDYIIVYENQMTSTCHKIIQDLFQYHMEVFCLQDFTFDFTQLYYFIPHEKIKDHDKIRELEERYGNKFPIILQHDPVCKYFGFQKNDILKITRSEKEIAYRIVK